MYFPTTIFLQPASSLKKKRQVLVMTCANEFLLASVRRNMTDFEFSKRMYLI